MEVFTTPERNTEQSALHLVVLLLAFVFVFVGWAKRRCLPRRVLLSSRRSGNDFSQFRCFSFVRSFLVVVGEFRLSEWGEARAELLVEGKGSEVDWAIGSEQCQLDRMAMPPPTTVRRG